MLEAWVAWLFYLGRPELEMLVFGVFLEGVRQLAPHLQTMDEDY